jgi:hypothetical protein
LAVGFRLSYRVFALTFALFACFSSMAQDEEGEVAHSNNVKYEIPGLGKNFIKGLKGTDSLSISRVWAASLLVPGYAQAYNKQYWKIPVIYLSAAGLAYGGARSHALYKETGQDRYLTQSRFYYAGVATVYLAGVIDGLASYKTSKPILPTKSMLYSTMLPGLGQAYNGDYWKIPVIYGGFAFMYYWYDLNQMQYQRFRRAYNEVMEGGTSEFPRLSPSSIKNYRDAYRRDRDFAVLYTALWYGVNIIDALVFAHLSDFDVSDELTMQISPAIIIDPMRYAAADSPAIGLSLSIKF